MKHLRYLLFLPLLLVPAAGYAQTAVDTVFITVEGALFETTITTIERKLQLGDTIEFVAVATDPDGDPVTAQHTWASSVPSIISIDAVTGVAIALQKTAPGQTVALYVLSEQVSELLLASFRDGELNWSGQDSIALQLWEPSLGDSTWVQPSGTTAGHWVYDYILVPNPDPTLQYCAYLVNNARELVSQDPGPPTCPVAFPTVQVPANALFASILRIRPLIQVRGAPG